MAKPTKEKIKKWFKLAFGRDASVDSSYFREWEGRFESPVKVWSYSDLKRRRALKRMFKKTFGKIPLDTNLNNPEYSWTYGSW